MNVTPCGKVKPVMAVTARSMIFSIVSQVLVRLFPD
jgi:hypothetical protein